MDHFSNQPYLMHHPQAGFPIPLAAMPWPVHQGYANAGPALSGSLRPAQFIGGNNMNGLMMNSQNSIKGNMMMMNSGNFGNPSLSQKKGKSKGGVKKNRPNHVMPATNKQHKASKLISDLPVNTKRASVSAPMNHPHPDFHKPAVVFGRTITEPITVPKPPKLEWSSPPDIRKTGKIKAELAKERARVTSLKRKYSAEYNAPARMNMPMPPSNYVASGSEGNQSQQPSFRILGFNNNANMTNNKEEIHPQSTVFTPGNEQSFDGVHYPNYHIPRLPMVNDEGASYGDVANQNNYTYVPNNAELDHGLEAMLAGQFSPFVLRSPYPLEQYQNTTPPNMFDPALALPMSNDSQQFQTGPPLSKSDSQDSDYFVNFWEKQFGPWGPTAMGAAGLTNAVDSNSQQRVNEQELYLPRIFDQQMETQMQRNDNHGLIYIDNNDNNGNNGGQLRDLNFMRSGSNNLKLVDFNSPLNQRS